MTKTTNLHHGARPPRSRPGPLTPDTAGCDDRTSSQPDPAAPDTVADLTPPEA